MKVWRLGSRHALAILAMTGMALVLALALTSIPQRLADPPAQALGEVQCGAYGFLQPLPEAVVTLIPEVGPPGSSLQVELSSIEPNDYDDQPAEALWDWDPASGGTLIGSGAVPEYESAGRIDAMVPEHAEPGDHTVTVCWWYSLDETWYYKTAAFGVPEPTLTPTPTPTPVPAPTPTPTPKIAIVGPGFPKAANPMFAPPPTESIAPTPDYTIAAIEVTQAQQCLDNTTGDTACADNQLPLVAGRFTWVRVYVASGTSAAIQNVPVRLKVSRNGTSWLTMNGTTTATQALIRDNINSSANFVLLCKECAADDVLSFQAEVNPDDTLVEQDDTNNVAPASGTLDLKVYERESPHIYAARMNYDPPGGGGGSVSTADVKNQVFWLVRTFPVSHWDPVVYEIGSLFDWKKSFSWPDVIAEANLLYTFGYVSPPDQVVVFVPGATGFNNGVSNPIWNGGKGIASIVDVGWTVAGNRSMVMTHEIGHNLGRRHPCTGGFADDPDWPYTGAGAVGLDYDIQETGIETDLTILVAGIFPIPLPSAVAHPSTQTEMMQGGHCGFTVQTNANDVRWVSPYTYQQLFCALSPNSATAKSCWQGNAVAIGSIAGGSAESITVAVNGVESVFVAGVVNPDATGNISTLYRVMDGTPDPIGEGEYCVELEDEGTVVGSHCFDVNFELLEVPTMPEPSPFSVVLAWVEGTDRIVLRHGTEVLDSVDVSANAPTVEVTAPADGGLLSGNQTVQWQAEDPDGDPLLFTLLYSWDGGANFFPIVANISETTYQANVDDLPGGNDAFYRVIATDNTGNSSTGDSGHFQVATKPPVPTIFSPEDNSEYQIGNAVTLMGSAADKEDGGLPSEAYIWSSDRDGQIADGPAGLVADLSPGWHTITLKVTDSDGQQGSASVRIFVGITTLVDVKPDALNLASPEPPSTVTAYTELPFGHDVNEVDTDSLDLLVGEATLSPTQATVGDFDEDGLADLELTFDGPSFISALPTSPNLVTATIVGSLQDGTPFRGHDIVDVVGALSLAAGWNHACYAGSQQGIDAALEPIVSQVLAVYRLRDDGGYDRWFADRPEVSTITTVNPFESFFVLMAGDASWVQDVSAMSPTSADLVMGWNSVCYVGLTEPVDEASATISTELNILYALGSDQLWHRYALGRPDITTISDLAHLTSVLALVTKEEGATWTFNLIR